MHLHATPTPLHAVRIAKYAWRVVLDGELSPLPPRSFSVLDSHLFRVGSWVRFTFVLETKHGTVLFIYLPFLRRKIGHGQLRAI